ncbi:late embryogenesis abundant protein At1g64065-like [Abrus precatorius]|uniref:Late embryogenesis abundant protein At1g64065-like n=1 Tax=Abrus precatorius TaxID=3816 RepID=A0A8B8M1N8_ABRPR|nr:late embryogenesis abundant protein At1g64065-like [Abrus precatorius]
MYLTRHETKQSSKCFVYALASFVTLFAIWVIFASIVLRVRDPNIELRSVRLMHKFNHSVSPLPSFNVTIIAQVTITNPNFGPFYYGNTSVSMLYGISSVGACQLHGARVKAIETQEINCLVNMKFNHTNDIHSGMLKLRCYVKLSGEVRVLKIVKKRKTIEMGCIMKLNFTSYSVQHLLC